MPLQKVVAVRDNDAHWYVIPLSKHEEFNNLLREAEENDDYYKFEDEFSNYRTGGDLNNIQLYADI